MSTLNKIVILRLLLTFSIVDTSSKVVINLAITVADETLSVKAYLTSKNVNISSIVEILVGCSDSSLTSVDQSYLNVIILNDLKTTYKPLMIYVVIR